MSSYLQIPRRKDEGVMLVVMLVKWCGEGGGRVGSIVAGGGGWDG